MEMAGKCASKWNVDLFIIINVSVLSETQNAHICLACVKYKKKNVLNWIKT